MKKSIFTLALAAAFVTSIFMVGCETTTQKSEKADSKVVDAQQDLKKAENAAADAKMKAAEEWRLFKTESEAKIDENDRVVAAMREKMKVAGKKMSAEYSKSIDALEVKSRNLRTKIQNYDTNQSDWEATKREFNHDMDELGQALKDLTVNNKK